MMTDPRPAALLSLSLALFTTGLAAAPARADLSLEPVASGFSRRYQFLFIFNVYKNIINFSWCASDNCRSKPVFSKRVIKFRIS